MLAYTEYWEREALISNIPESQSDGEIREGGAKTRKWDDVRRGKTEFDSKECGIQTLHNCYVFVQWEQR